MNLGSPDITIRKSGPLLWGIRSLDSGFLSFCYFEATVAENSNYEYALEVNQLPVTSVN